MEHVETQIAVVGTERELLRIRRRVWKMVKGRPERVAPEDVWEFTLDEVADALWSEDSP